MSVLTFDKKELGNLEYSLQREMLATDRRGGYMSTTIVCCNTRKYHGLMVAPIDDSDRAYVLLSRRPAFQFGAASFSGNLRTSGA